MEDKRKLYSLSFIIVLLVSACLVFIPQASAAPPPTWQTEEAATAGNGQTSMAIDSSGIIHVGYIESGNLMYTQKNGASWTPSVTVAALLSHNAISLATDSTGIVY